LALSKALIASLYDSHLYDTLPFSQIPEALLHAWVQIDILSMPFCKQQGEHKGGLRMVSSGMIFTSLTIFWSWVKVTENNRQNRTQETNFGTNTHFIAC
jgi:hypothetical protein